MNQNENLPEEENNQNENLPRSDNKQNQNLPEGENNQNKHLPENEGNLPESDLNKNVAKNEISIVPAEKKPGYFRRFWNRFVAKPFKVRTYPYICKKIGFWVALGTFTIAVIMALLEHFFNVFNPMHGLKPFPEILMIVGLWLITQSYEKVDDEGTKADRMLAYQFSYTVTVLILVFTLLQDRIFKETTVLLTDLVVTTLLCMYLVSFNYLKYQRNKRETIA